MNSLASYFSSAGFIPHGFCLLWRPDVLALHVISDAVIALSYFSIPLAITWFVRHRQDLAPEHRRIAILFSVFILGCGLTHLLGIVVLWRPIYVVDGWVKAFTALTSIVTALALWPLLPRLLMLPSPRQLELANLRLQKEIAARREALAKLEAQSAGLEAEVLRRTGEARALARRFQVATQGSLIAVAEQDEHLRYTWVHNAQTGPNQAVIGLTDDEVFGEAAAAVLTPLKRQALASGAPLRAEAAFQVDGVDRCFAVNISPAEEDGGGVLLIASTDITEQKNEQRHLQIIMRELAHRVKNMLSLVEGIARLTAKAEGVPPTLADRFASRLAALGAAHDLLISGDWRGVDIGALIRAQLAFVLPEARERITLEGPALTLKPEAGQYLVLALHELATNATKYGVLSASGGRLDIRWRCEPREDGGVQVELVWAEHGQPVAPPTRKGFGRQLLEAVIPRALGGKAALEFSETGLRWKTVFAQ
jgi:two-component sensor histidine kinase